MKNNRTSKAVAAWLSSFGRAGNCELKAICQRSERMEEALKAIDKQEHGEGNETIKIARDAINFDPLSSL